MNLTTDPWIPAVRADGTRALFSLQGLFAEAHELRDLAVKPHERIALMRLLLCITQAALDGPEDEAAWEQCEPLIQPRVRDYLAKWRGAFELFGEGQRFLQAAHLSADKKSGEKTRATKLDLTLATGNNATLFDNKAAEVRGVDPNRAALNLLTFQCFTPSEIVGAGVWHGIEVPKTTGKQAPCAASSAVHTLLLGGRVLESVWLNLFDRQLVGDLYGEHKWGKPLWELPLVSPRDNAQHKTTKENATSTYLGRLLPVSRLARLEADNQSILLVDGIAYPVFDNPKKPQQLLFREPHSTVLLDDKEQTLSLLRGDVGKSFWRELGAVVAKRRGEKSIAEGPPALCRRPQNRDIVVWMASLVTTKDEGIVDAIEGQYPIPKELLSEIGREAYERGIEFAVRQAQELAGLHGACALYQFSLSHQSASDEQFDVAVERLPRGEKSRLRDVILRAETTFWTQIESQLALLLDVPRTLKSDLWQEAVRSTASFAYEQSCPRQTPRQIQAFALGLRRLNAAPATVKIKQPKASKTKAT